MLALNENEVIIYWAEVDNDYDSLLRKYSDSFEDNRIKRFKKLKNERAKSELVTAGSLLVDVLNRYGLKTKDIEYTEKGKPYISEKFFFNLSHSGSLVMLAVSNEDVGLDVQKKVPFKQSLLERIATDGERKRLDWLITSEPETLWAVKESYSKLTGDGIGMDFQRISFDIINENIRVFEDSIPVAYAKKIAVLKNYSVVATREKDFFVTTEHIRL